MSHSLLFKWKHFRPEVILLNVCWYCRYALSYWDLEEMMVKRGLSIDHSTINRWVLQYGPELDKRCRPHLFTYTPIAQLRPCLRSLFHTGIGARPLGNND